MEEMPCQLCGHGRGSCRRYSNRRANNFEVVLGEGFEQGLVNSINHAHATICFVFRCNVLVVIVSARICLFCIFRTIFRDAGFFVC